MQHIKLDRKCLWSAGDPRLASPPLPLSVISASFFLFFLVFPAMFSSAPSPASLGEGRGRKKKSEGPLWLLIVLISPLDSPLIALLCLQGHHYTDQAQLCFSLLFMNIILPDDCFEVFSRQGSHLITYHYVNPPFQRSWREQDTISFTCGPFKSPTNLKYPTLCEVFFSPLRPTSVYTLKSSAAASRVLAARVREQTLSLHPSREKPKILVFTSPFGKGDACFSAHVRALLFFDALIKSFVLL